MSKSSDITMCVCVFHSTLYYVLNTYVIYIYIYITFSGWRIDFDAWHMTHHDILTIRIRTIKYQEWREIKASVTPQLLIMILYQLKIKTFYLTNTIVSRVRVACSNNVVIWVLKYLSKIKISLIFHITYFTDIYDFDFKKSSKTSIYDEDLQKTCKKLVVYWFFIPTITSPKLWFK